MKLTFLAINDQLQNNQKFCIIRLTKSSRPFEKYQSIHNTLCLCKYGIWALTSPEICSFGHNLTNSGYIANFISFDKAALLSLLSNDTKKAVISLFMVDLCHK